MMSLMVSPSPVPRSSPSSCDWSANDGSTVVSGATGGATAEPAPPLPSAAIDAAPAECVLLPSADECVKMEVDDGEVAAAVANGDNKEKGRRREDGGSLSEIESLSSEDLTSLLGSSVFGGSESNAPSCSGGDIASLGKRFFNLFYIFNTFL